MKTIISGIILFIFTGCSGSSDIPSDFSLTYNTRNELMNWEVNITVNSENLNLHFFDGQNNISSNGTIFYRITENEAGKIYKYMKSSGFLALNPPAGEKVLDMPTQNLSGKFNGKTNYIEFGTVKDIPESISTLKQMLYDLASKYNKSWKKDMGLE